MAVSDHDPWVLSSWRILGTSSSLAAALVELVDLLAELMPVRRILLRELDVGRARLETVADSEPQASAATGHGVSELPAAALQELVEACRTGVVAVQASDRDGGALARAIPAGCRGDTLLAGLSGSGGSRGLLLMVAAPEKHFGTEHQELVAVLVEAFSAALDTHCRLHHLVTEREAAEADRRSLLSRLGRREISEIVIGVDSGLREVMERVEQVALSDVPVLIFGETGSGKEVVARAIHNRSRRAHGPFLRVNCGAIPGELVDSELFGHERGSFTGATQMRKGWFERADGGTLFLDEVAELSPAAQVRLLRVLQDGSFERVGGQKQLRVDVRIVAATHRDLFRMVANSRFREDLWYRLAVFPVDLPPLRERRQDLAALAAHLALQASRRFGLAYQAPSAADVELLAAYPWPGNIRELAAVIDRAAILGDGRRLEIARALGASRSVVDRRSRGSVPALVPGAGEDAFETLEELNRRHIEAALERTGGRVDGPHGAARLLALNPHTLRSRMRRMRIDWRCFRHP